MAENFHALCDGFYPTLVFVKSKEYGRVFGGFTDVPWSSTRGSQYEPHAYMFSVDDEIIYHQKGSYSIYQNPNWGPTFADMTIYNNSNSITYNMDKIGEEFGFESGAIGGDLCCKGSNEGYLPGQNFYF